MQNTQISELTVFYTGNLGGDLQMLPRLYTFLQQLRQKYDSHALLLDIGNACATGVWHCDVTGGRSTVIVLDGMGYHAVNVSGFLAAGQREILQNTITTGLIDARHNWRYDVPPLHDEGIIVAAGNVPALTLCIAADQADQTWLDNRTLWLHRVQKEQVGIVRLDLQALKILSHDIVVMPANLKPDATITASVEFVEEEARYYQKRLQS